MGERSEPIGSLRREKGGASLSPSPGHPSAHFLRRYFSFLTPFFAFFPHCGAWSRANDSYAMKLKKLSLNDKITASCLKHIISIVTNNKIEHWKTVRSTSFPKPQLISVSVFFKFINPCFFLYLLYHLYLLLIVFERLFYSFTWIGTLGTRGFPRVRRRASHERDQNRKLRIKSLWHIEYRFTDRARGKCSLDLANKLTPPTLRLFSLSTGVGHLF